MRALILGVMLTGCFVRPVYAAEKETNELKLDEEQRRKDDEGVDKQYKATLKRTNKETTATRSDPWMNMRGAEDPKTKR
jgi:hypothetical protein